MNAKERKERTDKFLDFMEAKLDEMKQILNGMERTMIEGKTPEYLTIKEACQYAKISTTTFHELKKDGLIKVYRLGGKVLVKKREISEMIERTAAPTRA